MGWWLLGRVTPQVYGDLWYVLALINSLSTLAFWIILPRRFLHKQKYQICLFTFSLVILVATLIHNAWLLGHFPLILNLILAAIILGFSFRQPTTITFVKILKYFTMSIGILLSIIAFLLYMITSPVTKWPKVAGPYEIGVVQTVLIDKTRKENLLKTKTPNERHIPIIIWYPAVSAENYPVAPPFIRPTKTIPISTFFRAERNIATNVYIGAPLAHVEKPYPIIVYLHGFTGHANANLTTIETLTRHGYIVVGITHPDSRSLSGIEKTKLFKDEFSNILKPENAIRLRRYSDVNFVLKNLQRLNSTPFVKNWKEPFNLSKINCMGMSLGAHVLLEITPSACETMVLLDPVSIFKTPINKPFLMFNSMVGFGIKSAVSKASRLKNNQFVVLIKESRHVNFIDESWKYPVFFWVTGIGCDPASILCNIISRGSIDPSYAIKQTNKMILNFLNVYVKGNGKFSPYQHMDEFPHALIFFKQPVDEAGDESNIGGK